MSVFFGTLPLCERNLRAWRPYAPSYLMRMAELPMELYIYGFALAFLGKTFAPDQNYASFLLPGILTWCLTIAVIIDATYTTYIRAFNYRIWQSILITPVKLPAILLAEQAVAIIKGFCLLLLAYPFALLFHAVPTQLGFLMALLPGILLIMAITAMGHLMTSLARNEYDFDLLWPLFATPMFLTSGVMFPRSLLPEWLQWVSNIFPMTHAVAAMRPVMLDSPYWPGFFGHGLALFAMWLIFSGLSYCLFKRRLED